MTLMHLLDSLDIYVDIDKQSEEAREILLEMEIDVHQQPNYPLRSYIQNVRVLDGKLAIAVSEASEYGSKKAWEDPMDEEEEE